MKARMKIAVVTVVALLIAFASSYLVQTSNGPLMAEYEQRLNAAKSKRVVSDEEKAELEAMFRQLNSAENIQQELAETVVKNGLFFLITIPLAFLAGRKLAMTNNDILATAALIAVSFILVGFLISGALLGAVFAVTGLSKNQKALREA